MCAHAIMINYYKTENGRLDQIDEAENGCWVSVIDPTPQEIKMLIDDFGLDSGFVKSSLDEEESSRIEREDDQTLIIIDTPVSSTEDDETQMFYTMPIGIIITEENLAAFNSDNRRGSARNYPQPPPHLQDPLRAPAPAEDCGAVPVLPEADR